MSDPVDIMLVTSCRKGRVDPEIYDLIAFGRRLQALGAGPMGVWILGEDVNEAAREIAHGTGVPVTGLQDGELANYVNEAFGAMSAREIESVDPTYVCVAHTSRGWEWAPALAARIDAGCICAVDGLVETRGRLCFQRDVYGGKAKGLYTSSATTTVITVQPGAFKFEPAAHSIAPNAVTLKNTPCTVKRTRYLGLKQGVSDTSRITEAPIIVAVGNGIGDFENMALIHRLAGSLPGAAVAGTRIVCDRGWLGYNGQVGVTGASVSPDLYLACGISGASQHVTGMRGSGFVIAINTDPHAPMFNEADICIVENVIHFIPLLEDACARLAGNAEQDFVDSKTLRR